MGFPILVAVPLHWGRHLRYGSLFKFLAFLRMRGSSVFAFPLGWLLNWLFPSV